MRTTRTAPPSFFSDLGPLPGYVPTMSRAAQVWTPGCFDTVRGPEREVVTALLCHVPCKGAPCLETSCPCCETASQRSLAALSTWIWEEERGLEVWESEELSYGRLRQTVKPLLQWATKEVEGSGEIEEVEEFGFSKEEASLSRQKTVLAAAVLTRLVRQWGRG